MIRTRLLRPNLVNLAAAADILRAGGLVAFPTETVYGLGANAYDADAARRVYKAKGRPSDNPLIVHVSDEAMLVDVVRRISPLARKLIKAFWPGPLTLIFDKSSLVPGAVTAGRRTVAVRCPGHPTARALIRALGSPIAAPSANRSGRPSPTTAGHVHHDLVGRIALIIDGGACRRGLESTIIDARGKIPVLLRHGTLTEELIARAVGVAVASPGRRAPAAPGTRHRHYAPSCRVILVSPALVRRGLLTGPVSGIVGLVHRTQWRGRRLKYARRARGGVADYAASLFSALRDAETAQVKTLYVETVEDRGIGKAVMDRLRRAARP